MVSTGSTIVSTRAVGSAGLANGARRNRFVRAGVVAAAVGGIVVVVPGSLLPARHGGQSEREVGGARNTGIDLD